MKLQINPPKFLKQRKLLVLLPLVALPFIIFLCWFLVGGKTSDDEPQPDKQAFNMALPEANLEEDKALDKMSYYDKAASDSAKLKELMKNDPYFKNQEGSGYDESYIHGDLAGDQKARNGGNIVSSRKNEYTDPNEAKVYQKLEQLNAALNAAGKIEDKPAVLVKPHQETTSIDQSQSQNLQQQMQSISQKNEEDPELQQLNGMLNKVLDIQHPELVQERIRQTSKERKGQVFEVSVKDEKDLVSTFGGGNSSPYNTDTIKGLSNRFYSLEDQQNTGILQNAIKAVVHETQTLVNGSTIKLRLVNDVYINGSLIPKDNFVFGLASLNGERLTVKINSIRYQNALFATDLSVCDMDGLEGIFIPGAISRDVAKQSSDLTLQNVGYSNLDPSFKAQAASAGIDAAKSLLSKKVKLIKVIVKAGYYVLLMDEKQKQNN